MIGWPAGLTGWAGGAKSIAVEFGITGHSTTNRWACGLAAQLPTGCIKIVVAGRLLQKVGFLLSNRFVGPRNIMRRAAWRLSLPCCPRGGAHPGVRPPRCADCRMALPHATLEFVTIRGILSRPESCPRRNTSGRWFPAPALELAGVHPLDGVAILVDRSRSRNLASLSWRDVALPARLVEAVDRRWAAGSGSARSLLHPWGSQETGRRGLDLPSDHARPRRGTGIPGRVSVLVEPCFRKTVATGRRGVRLGAHHHCHPFRRVQRPCRRRPSTPCPYRSPRGYCPVLAELGFRMGTRTHR